MTYKILIIDDDEDLAMITADMLGTYGYEVFVAKDSEIAYQVLKEKKFHLILLDINLPKETGFHVCQELRKVSTIPIIFASARTAEADKITGLDMGGDDYLPKPYSLKELLSRINALIRRTYGFLEKDNYYVYRELEINKTTRTVKNMGKRISLSLKEFDLLLYLVEHKGEAISKETLLQEVWGIYSEVEIATVAVHIRWLREKIELNPSKPSYIKTVWGIGYRWEEEEIVDK